MKIGITGGIGSGKTYICQQLKAAGFPVYDCDTEAKRLMQESPEIRAQLTQLIGPEAYTPQGELGKAAIASYLFDSQANAEKVNRIVHPVVRRDFQAWCQLQTAAHCFMESAILFESGFDTTVDRSVLVYADTPTRLQRAMQRDQATEQQIEARMAQQISTEAAKQRADYVLDNSQHANTATEIARMLTWLTTQE